MKSILLVKKRLGLVEMTSGLVNASFSLPKWLAVKMIFLAQVLFVYCDITRNTKQWKELHLTDRNY